jgi:hypothetical protein
MLAADLSRQTEPPLNKIAVSKLRHQRALGELFAIEHGLSRRPSIGGHLVRRGARQ